MDERGCNEVVHESLLKMCRSYQVCEPIDASHPANRFNPADDNHMVALQNKVSNTRSGNPHNHGGQPGQKLPKEARGVSSLAGSHRIKQPLPSDGAPKKTLDAIVPPYTPGISISADA